MIQSMKKKPFRFEKGPLKAIDKWWTAPKFEGTEKKDELAEVHQKYHIYFELGTLYTVVAGLLNILAIYDACCGPLLPIRDQRDSGDNAETESG